MTTRRRFLEAGGGVIGGLLTRGSVASAGRWLARGLPVAAGAAVFGWPRRAEASVVLNPENISNFTQVGGQSPATGPQLLFADAMNTDVSGLFAPDADAAAGKELDLQATFQVTSQASHGVDAGFQVVINDGASNRAGIAACILINNLPHIGLVGVGPRDQLATYPAFIQAEWQAATLTILIRRSKEGGLRLLEVNGVPPAVPVELAPAQLPPGTRAAVTAELGCFSPQAIVNASVSEFFTQAVVQPVPQLVDGKLTFNRFRIRDTDSADRLRFRAEYALGTAANGIDPTTEPVIIKLSTLGGVFYEQTLNGFTARGQAPRRRWALNDAERARTGIEQLLVDEGPGNTGTLFLRDARIDLWDEYFGVVNAEIVIGAGSLGDRLTGTAQLLEIPQSGGKWRFHREA